MPKPKSTANLSNVGQRRLVVDGVKSGVTSEVDRMEFISLNDLEYETIRRDTLNHDTRSSQIREHGFRRLTSVNRSKIQKTGLIAFITRFFWISA